MINVDNIKLRNLKYYKFMLPSRVVCFIREGSQSWSVVSRGQADPELGSSGLPVVQR